MKNNNKKVKIYRRLLKYSPFYARRRAGIMRIIHNLRCGLIESIAPEQVSVNDAEKLYTAIYLANQTQNVECRGEQAIFTVAIKDIKKMCNIKNEKYISRSMSRGSPRSGKISTPDKSVSP